MGTSTPTLAGVGQVLQGSGQAVEKAGGLVTPPTSTGGSNGLLAGVTNTLTPTSGGSNSGLLAGVNNTVGGVTGGLTAGVSANANASGGLTGGIGGILKPKTN